MRHIAVNLKLMSLILMISKVCDGLKVLGKGEITKKLTVCAAVFSETAKGKIEAAGGKTEVV